MSSSVQATSEARWDQNPMYTAAISQLLPRGSTMTYEPSRKVKYTTIDRTNLLEGQCLWSETNRPEILQIEKPPAGWKEWALSHVPRHQIIPAGTPRNERWPDADSTPRVLREFPVLPKQIFSGEPGWALEAWMRLDPTITYDDILMRMHVDTRPSAQDLQMRRARFRNDEGLEFWEAVPTHQHDFWYQMHLAQLPGHRVRANLEAMGRESGSNDGE